MSAYRLNYTPAPQRRPRPLLALARALVLMLAAVGCGLLAALVLHASAAVGLAEIRVQAFRAGYQSAAEQGCTPALAFPLAQAAQ